MQCWVLFSLYVGFIVWSTSTKFVQMCIKFMQIQDLLNTYKNYSAKLSVAGWLWSQCITDHPTTQPPTRNSFELSIWCSRMDIHRCMLTIIYANTSFGNCHFVKKNIKHAGAELSQAQTSLSPKKILLIIGFMLLKLTGLSSRFPHKNRFWKISLSPDILSKTSQKSGHQTKPA